MSGVVIALDAGGTKLVGGLVTRDGDVLERDQLETPRSAGRCDSGLTALHALANRLGERGRAAGHQVEALGLGIAEYVRDGQLTSAEVFDWRDQPRDLFASLADPGPVAVDADVRCAATAEAKLRRQAKGDSMLFVSWGTGLSSTLVLDGRCVGGHRGEALALGEWPVDGRTDPTWVSNLERFASGLGIAERYAVRTSRSLTGVEVAGRALKGDSDARLLVESAADAVAHAITSMIQVVDPAVVVLGGGIGTGAGALPARVQEVVPQLLARPGAPPVEAAIAGADAGLVGAGLLAWGLLG